MPVGARLSAALATVFSSATAVDLDAFEERAAIAEHDGELPREDAERLAAGEQGFDSADDLHAAAVAFWSSEIDRLARAGATARQSGEALRRAQAFVREGWALQAARLGWDELDLFGVCPRAPWRNLDRNGAAFGGAVQAVTREAVAYVGGHRRYRARSHGGAVPVWEMNGEAEHGQP